MTMIADLNGVEVEHLLGDTFGPLVQIRAISTHHRLLGQVTPDAARQIASHLMECAARAEYEADLYTELRRVELDDEAIGLIMHAVRAGEQRRHESNG